MSKNRDLEPQSGHSEPAVAHSVEETYGFAFLKAGYESILPAFSQKLAEVGLHSVHVTSHRLHPRTVDAIYPESVKEPFYPLMQRFLGERAVLAMVLESETSEPPAQSILNSLKRGTDGYPNLRTLYQKKSDIVNDEDFERWCRGEHAPEEQDTLTIKLTQGNVFHAADDPEDAMDTFSTIHTVSPEFFEPNDTTDVRKLERLVEYLATFN